MASITFSGQLDQAMNEAAAEGNKILFIPQQTVGEVLPGAASELVVESDGLYSITLAYNTYSIYHYSDVTKKRTLIASNVVVSADTAVSTIPDLIGSTVPVTEDNVLTIQGYLTEAQDSATAAATSESNAAASEAAVTNRVAAYEVESTDYLINTFDGSSLLTGDVVRTLGYSTAGDGGGAEWVKTGEAGTASQSPSDVVNSILYDSLGIEFELVKVNDNKIESLGIPVTHSSIQASVSSGGCWVLSSDWDASGRVVVSEDNYKLEINSTVTMSYDEDISGKLFAISSDYVYLYINKVVGNIDTQENLNSLISISGDDVRCFGNFYDVGDLVIFSSGDRSNLSGCRMFNCGRKNKLTDDTDDRRQGIAVSGAESPKVNNCHMEGIGLDFVSFASLNGVGCSNVECKNGVFIGNDAGGLYNSNSDRFNISNNIVIGNDDGSTSGHGFDNINSSNGVMLGNVAYLRGASGLLIATGCDNITVSGLIAYNNGTQEVSGTQGGIAMSGDISNIIIDGAVIYDDQDTKTQLYAIDDSTVTSAVNVRVSGTLKCYDSSGDILNVPSRVTRSFNIGALSVPQYFNITSGSEEILVNYSDGSDFEYKNIEIIVINNNAFASLVVGKDYVKKITDTLDYIETSDIGDTLAIYYDSTTECVVLKNNHTSTRTVQVRLV